MSLRSWLAANPRAARFGRIAGIAIYAVAFLLPACRFTGHQSELVSLGTYSGWKCAEFSLVLITIPETYRSPLFLAVLGGLINPMLILFVALFQPRFRKTRRILTIAIAASLVATWIFFVFNQFLPLIGHVLWVVGICMVLVDDFVPAQIQQRE